LRDDLTQKVERKMQTTSGSPEAASLEKEIAKLTEEYRDVSAQVRLSGVQFADNAQPQPLKLQEIQARGLEHDTLLLEFFLGEEKSYLWLVSSDSIDTYELPARVTIEDAANRVRSLLTAPAPIDGESLANRQKRVQDAEQQYWKEATALSAMLLTTAASKLGQKRLLVVADGALQYIPFNALPAPGSTGNPVPLMVDHEISYDSSASTLVLIRNGKRQHEPSGAVAVFADPVFEADDPRLTIQRQTPDASLQAQNNEQFLQQAFRDVGVSWAGRSIPRLLASREEAKAVLDATSGAVNRAAIGFDADKANATAAGLNDYRIIHFATHGVFDSEHPELSGLLLSRFDSSGRPKEGFLRLDDIYNLELSADLVVLSACNTGLGKDIKGEGLVGLVRGFMYAGTRRVVASLWKVDDDATAELMKEFYQQMLQQGRSPAAALRAAQLAMWQKQRWRAPYFWGAFVLQGEYSGTIEVDHRRVAILWYLAPLMVLLLILFVALRRAHSHR
jgi:CHAT domain-containing protein